LKRQCRTWHSYVPRYNMTSQFIITDLNNESIWIWDISINQRHYFHNVRLKQVRLCKQFLGFQIKRQLWLCNRMCFSDCNTLYEIIFYCDVLFVWKLPVSRYQLLIVFYARKHFPCKKHFDLFNIVYFIPC
jgi:hypothetical protein